MGNINFNLNELYGKVFGHQAKTGSYDSSLVATQQTITAKNILGQLLFEQITFKTPTMAYTFPDCPLIDITASKNIVTTPIQGRNGSVKEYISIDDYQVTIRGILINYDNDDYPEELVYNLHQVFKVEAELQVLSPVLNLLDIHNLVIKDIKFPEVEGYSNIQPFVLQCLSDEPLELVIKDAKNQTKN